MRANILGRLAVAFGVAMSLARPAGAAPDPTMPAARMEVRTEGETHDTGPFGEYWWANRFLSRSRLIEEFQGKTVDLVMVGDSITHFWEWHRKSWAEFTNGRSVLNLGVRKRGWNDRLG